MSHFMSLLLGVERVYISQLKPYMTSLLNTLYNSIDTLMSNLCRKLSLYEQVSLPVFLFLLTLYFPLFLFSIHIFLSFLFIVPSFNYT